MKIGTHEVGPGHPTFIVAEGGSNHGGSLDAALALTDAAADAGASAMKWQLWLSADEMYDPAQFPAEHASAARWRLPAEWLPALRDRAHERGMAFGLSSFGFASLDEADKWVDFHKVASIEAAWSDFVHAVINKSEPSRPMLISLGGGVIERPLNSWLPEHVVPLHCVVAYPAEICDYNLLSHQVGTGRGLWGLSDHTTHPTIAPCAAVALGACVVEKHIKTAFKFGDGKTLPPDWNHSLWDRDFKRMVEVIRMTEQALGSSEKRIRKSEEPYLKYRRGPRGLRGS